MDDEFNFEKPSSKKDKGSFGERLRSIRKQSKLSQKDFGLKLGLSLPSVHRLEQSERWPHDELLVKVMEEFHCDPVWLITGRGVSGTDLDDSFASRVQTRLKNDQFFRAEILMGLGLKPPDQVLRNQRIYNLLQEQRSEWEEIVELARQYEKGAPVQTQKSIGQGIESFQEGIDYLNVLLEVGIDKFIEENDL